MVLMRTKYVWFKVQAFKTHSMTAPSIWFQVALWSGHLTDAFWSLFQWKHNFEVNHGKLWIARKRTDFRHWLKTIPTPSILISQLKYTISMNFYKRNILETGMTQRDVFVFYLFFMYTLRPIQSWMSMISKLSICTSWMNRFPPPVDITKYYHNLLTFSRIFIIRPSDFESKSKLLLTSVLF